MNIAECNILMELQRSGSTSQRALARAVGHSLGVVNRSLKALHEAGYIDDGCRPKEKAAAELRLFKERWIQRKYYKFFTCPSCRASLRVPRHRGKIKIVCRKCGTSFFGKT